MPRKDRKFHFSNCVTLWFFCETKQLLGRDNHGKLSGETNGLTVFSIRTSLKRRGAHTTTIAMHQRMDDDDDDDDGQPTSLHFRFCQLCFHVFFSLL